MAVAFRTSSAGGGTTGTGNRTSTISAVAGDLLIVGVQWSANADRAPTCTDDQAGSYDLITTAVCDASSDLFALFIRRGLVRTTATITVAPVVGSGTNTAGEIVTLAYTGMTRCGKSAIRQVAGVYQIGIQENQTTGVPTPVLPAAALTGNATMMWAGSTAASGTITAVPNASWTERQDAQQASPATALEASTRDSGFTGTSAAYVSIVSVLWDSTIIELDSTTPDFLNFDKELWPIPEGLKVTSKGQPSVDLKTFLNQLDPYLIGQDSFFYGTGRGPVYDYPNPRGAQYPINLRTWQAAPFPPPIPPDTTHILRAPLYTRLDAKGFPISLRSWDSGNLLGTTLGGPVQSPFFQNDWPNPRGATACIDLRTWIDQLNVLAGTDQFFGLAGHPTYDWPVPKGAVPSITLRTWVESLFAGQDTFFGLAGHPTFDWPVPKGATPATTLKTWTDPSKIWLIGRDTFFGLAGSPTFDWPNPRGYVPVIDLKTWIDKSKTQLIGQDFLPFAQDDWPVPRGPIPAIILRTLIQQLNILIGQDQFFGLGGSPQFNWPNPRGPIPATDLKTWVQELLPVLLGQDRFFGLAGHPNFDWPNPRGPVPVIDLRTWLERYKLELIGQDQLPELNVQWPVPKGPIPAIDLRTWLEHYKLELIGQDQLPFDQTDWPNPRGKQSPTLTWDHSDLLNTVYNMLVPFVETKWPNPRGPIRAIDLNTWLNAVRGQLIGKDLLPFDQFSWPNPRGATPGQQWTAPGNPNLLPSTPPVTAEQLRQIIRFAPIAFGGKTHWGR